MNVRELVILVVAALLAVSTMAGCQRVRILENEPTTPIGFDRHVVLNEQAETPQAPARQEPVAESPVAQPVADDAEAERETTASPSSNTAAEAPQSRQPAAADVASKSHENAPKADKPSEADATENNKDDDSDENDKQDVPPEQGKTPDDEDEQTSDEGGETPSSEGDDVNQDTDPTPQPDDDTKRDTEEEPSQQETIDAAVATYTRMFKANHQTVYPCQQTYIYCELEEDYQAASRHSASAINAAILAVDDQNLGAGKDDVVSDAWVLGQADGVGVIVKIVPATVLGPGVADTSFARAVVRDICSREGWSALPAVKDGKVIAVSTSLFDTEAGTTLFKLYLAMTSYPDVYADLFAAGGIASLQQELMPDESGVFFYPQEP